MRVALPSQLLLKILHGFCSDYFYTRKMVKKRRSPLKKILKLQVFGWKCIIMDKWFHPIFFPYRIYVALSKKIKNWLRSRPYYKTPRLCAFPGLWQSRFCQDASSGNACHYEASIIFAPGSEKKRWGLHVNGIYQVKLVRQYAVDHVPDSMAWVWSLWHFVFGTTAYYKACDFMRSSRQ